VSSVDVAEYILAGSTAVQVGTANYRNPGIGEDMVDSLNKWIEQSKWNSVADMIGKVSIYN
jgi:Dihydroorotate dehydrogenase